MTVLTGTTILLRMNAVRDNVIAINCYKHDRNADIGRVYDMLVWRQCGHRHSMLSLVYTEVEGGDGTASLRGGASYVTVV